MISTLGELEQLLKILRSQGVHTFKWSGLEFIMTEHALTPEQIIQSSNPIAANPEFPTQAELDRAVGLPVGGLEDPFVFLAATPNDKDPEDSE